MDTIAALATPEGRGATAMVRISGAQAVAAARALLGPRCPLLPRHAHFVKLRCPARGDVIDQGIAIFFPAPASFTGEDVVELQLHGSPAIVERTLQVLTSQGVRLAAPGEFTQRAYLLGKLDLTQAEAVADVIESASAEASRAALKTLTGEFSRTLNQLLGDLIHVRVKLEAQLDFPDEEVPDVSPEDLLALRGLLARVDEVLQAGRRGWRQVQGLDVALIGAPNVGKSSLLNRLCGEDLAIVTDLPGTTRDVIRGQALLRGVPVTFHDTAGLRQSVDPVERIGISKVAEVLRRVDVVLRMHAPDAPAPSDWFAPNELPADLSVIEVHNKSDIATRTRPATASVEAEAETLPPTATLQSYVDGGATVVPAIEISAKTGEGIETLIDALVEPATDEAGIEPFSARPRHLHALSQVRVHLLAASACAEAHTADLAAQHLSDAQHALSEITGEYTNEDLLGAIFSSFCIGK